MNNFEVLTLIVSLLAIVISTVTLVRTRKLAKEQLDLDRINANLSKLQIKVLRDEEENKNHPKFNVSLLRNGQSSHFYISNTGKGTAYNVQFELLDCSDNPLTSDYKEKFPHPKMTHNSRVKLNASLHLNSPLKHQVRLSWEDNTGNGYEEIFWVTR